MSFPFYLRFGALRLHPHAVFEVLAYAVALQIYLVLRRNKGDVLDLASRWWIIAAAAAGAVLGSKLLYWLEDPRLTLAHRNDPSFLMAGKTVVGALIGGLFAVEWIKTRLEVTSRTGDLFAVPLCVGIAIGRVGCFLTGLKDHTSGVATSLPWGVNFGDGILRHPTQLYELLFVLTLGGFLWRRMLRVHVEGDIFKMFMAAYFAFRLLCDFLKPDVRVLLGLSSIQWACVAMLLYYSGDIMRWLKPSSAKTQESRAYLVQRDGISAMTMPPSPPARKRSRVLPILITIACGLVLAVGSCFGGFATEKMGGGRQPLTVLFGWGIVTGVVVFIGGIIWAFVALVVHYLGAKKEQP